MYITEECIDCSACVDECEQKAIYQAGEQYELNSEMKAPLSDDHTFIVPELCDQCKSCVEVCAVDAIEER
ncbi:4fe-4s ferredoxin, iron-sulfur binding [hydrocarbon metagenome]|uniref:4fe-4s ferredoxin, iron-sulfur binding n=1 Tax=hydrocarbon metagenome TaxID=938273 RepID=A0A0W8FVD9_9ZZZZ